MFWPESPEDRARHTLNQMLYRLRRTLGDEVLVSRGQDEIGVSADHLRSDAAAFRVALEDARWEDALTLYRGPFLPGFYVSRAPDLERWIDEERQDHRRAAREAAVALSEHREQKGDLREATRWAKRAWEIEPSSDSLLRRILILLHRVGERAEAMALFENFKRRVDEDYGLEPSAEMLELVATIRAEEPTRVEGGGRLPALSAASDRSIVPGGVHLPTSSAPQHGRGLGGTLAGAGAALLGAAAVSWVLLAYNDSTTASPALESTAPVVVVLPVVVNGSVSPDHGDMARALTSELTTRLGENPGLLVVPTESVDLQLQECEDAVEIGLLLQGDAVVQSGLDWQSTGLEASARVTDVVTGEVIWGASRRYPHTELLSAQQFLTVGIASALNVRLAPTLPDRDLNFSSKAEEEAWILASRADGVLREAVALNLKEERARPLIQRALALDPECAPAYAARSLLFVHIWRAHRAEAHWLDSAVVAANHAMSLEPDNPGTQEALALVMINAALSYPERYPPAEVRRGAEAALRAVQLNPSSARASELLGQTLRRQGRRLLWYRRGKVLNRDWLGVQSNHSYYSWLLGDYDAAIEAQKLAIEVDPPLQPPQSFRLPEYELSRGRLLEARQQIEAVRTRDPELVPAFPVAIYLELMEGRYEAAEVLIEELLSRDPPVEVIATSNFHTRSALGYVYMKTGRIREGKRLLEAVRDDYLDRIQAGGPGHSEHYNLARMYALLGEPDQAVHWLGVAIDRGWPFYYTEMGRTDPMLENLLGNEGFEKLMDDLKAELDAERAWAMEMLALPEPERFRRMLIDAEEVLTAFFEAERVG
jgi:DNA-binding SARP family transcriptional activator/TolB-like protein